MENFTHKEWSWGPEELLHQQSHSYYWLKKPDLYLPTPCYPQAWIMHNKLLFPFQFSHSLISMDFSLERGGSAEALAWRQQADSVTDRKENCGPELVQVPWLEWF